MEVTIANPAARIIETHDTTWIAAGLDEDGVRELTSGNAALAPGLCRRTGDATLIRVRSGAGGPRVEGWRGLTSGHEIFYRLEPGEGARVADHFRNLLATVPVEERVPGPEVLCDHFLFRTVPGPATFCSGVHRLERGHALTIDVADGTARTRRFDRIEAQPRPSQVEDYLDRLDTALESALAPWRAPGVAALFSGGVDSTLVHTYLGAATPALCYTLPHYACEFEADYVDRAAALLGVGVEKHESDTANYLACLERAIDDTALPPPHPQFALYRPLFATPHHHFLMGEQADALFGIEMRKARLAAPFTSALGRRAIDLAASLTAGHPSRRLRVLGDTAARLSRDPGHPDGYAAQFGIYTDWRLLEEVFGESLVRGRVQVRLAHMQDALVASAPAGDAFLRHLEGSQIMDLLCEDVMSCFRHLAHAADRTISSPFVTRAVLDAALSVPVAERYVRGLQVKYLPKLLLQRRLPGYPVHQRKGYTDVPFGTLYGGPLGDVWQRYTVPEAFQGEHRDRLIGHASAMTWNAITLAIWRDRVQCNDDLRRLPGTRTLHWSRETTADGRPAELAAPGGRRTQSGRASTGTE